MVASVENEILPWEEIKKRFPNQWVVLGEPVLEDMKVVKGIVISHHADKRVASMEGGKFRKAYIKVTLRYTGESSPKRTIGYMRTIDPIKPS
jgi:hypothetical protein